MYDRLFQLQEEIFKTLANQKRLEILQLLAIKELTVSELVTMLGVPQANLSQHLAVLRKLNIVSTRKNGLMVYYRLTDKKIALVIKKLQEFLKVQYANDPQISQISLGLNKNLYPIVKDPVCGMRLSISEIGDSVIVDKQTFYFCASGCKEKFLKSRK